LLESAVVCWSYANVK